VRQKSNTRNLIFNSYQLVSFISQAITLQPGDLIYSGTPAGVGAFRKPPVFLKGGDVVEVSIQGIGVLSNRVTG
jgi:2-keto-4-pentenoate hydratase/2-oxohepta-3-ene-1,7-dioic acid hydratase in catechol pathway